MIAFVIQDHPDRTCANLRCEFVGCLTHRRPFLSGVRASGNPGAVHTDRHISPDGQFLKIDTGDYTLTPLNDGTTKLTLRTNYIARTHVNLYAQMWGEILLGDIESNILTIIKQRAEAAKARL